VAAILVIPLIAGGKLVHVDRVIAPYETARPATCLIDIADPNRSRWAPAWLDLVLYSLVCSTPDDDIAILAGRADSGADGSRRMTTVGGLKLRSCK
jgi:hypothetical protein